MERKKIAVEIKTFRSPSPVADLEQAIGQYSLYEDILQLLEAERTLYLTNRAQEPHQAGVRLSIHRGDCSMAAVESLREAIAQVFHSWEQYPDPVLPLFKIVSVMDASHDRYTLTHLDFDGDRYKSHLLAYLEIRDGKIWILTDNTEDGIAPELVAEGIAKNQIVLGFYPPALREAGEFATR